MNLVGRIIIGAVLLLTTASAGFAWNELGHVTIAQIAYRNLSATERQAVVQILRQHPHANTYFKLPAGLDVPEEEWVILRAATWCDFIRPPRGMDRRQIAEHPIHKFHRGPWHYINYPYQAGQTVLEQLPTPLTPTEGEDTDVIRQLRLTKELLLGTATIDPGRASNVTDAENRAVRLCWLFHLAGDIHQPLHATALVNSQLFPGPAHGDQGGNLILIRTSRNSQPVNLHAYWDGVAGYITSWREASNVQKLEQDISRCRQQADLLTRAALSREMLPELPQHPDFVDWAAESYQQAVTVAYDHGRLSFATRKDVDENRVARDAIPVLTPVLQEKARAVANKRLALAGYRLADQLREIAEK